MSEASHIRFRAITGERFDRFTSNLVCVSRMGRGRFLLKTGARWCCLVHQVASSENGFRTIIRECFDQFTSNVVCGSFMDRGWFLLKTGTRWFLLKMDTVEHFDKWIYILMFKDVRSKN